MVKKKENKPADPISERTRALNDQIATLEAQIKKLDTQLHSTARPKLRSTAIPHGATIPRKPENPPQKSVSTEPVFEEIKPVPARAETESPELFNDMGVRKYDLPGLFGRLRNMFNGPPANNPRLVNYLAAGGVQGLRPLRYEKRVARNRFLVFAAALFVLLLGTLLIYLRNH
jgi:cell division protein FtsB